MRHQRGPRLRARCRSASIAWAARCRPPCARCSPICRSATAIGDTGSGGASDQRRNRPLFSNRPAQRRARIGRTHRAGVLSRHACLRGRPPDRRRRHHAAGDRLHQLLERRAGRCGDAVARRRGLVVRLCAFLLSRRPAGGQRGDHPAALLHAAQTRRRALHRAGPRQAGQDGALLRAAAASG